MPLYEYRCQSCGKNEEVLESMTAPEEHDCSSCGTASGMKRQVSKPAFNLAGSGWYAQGYSKDGCEGSCSAPAKAQEKPAGGCCGGCCHGHD